VLLPERNEADLADVPPSTRKEMKFTYLKTVDDAIAHALEPSRLPLRRGQPRRRIRRRQP
jgi:ATP-dependent Lon protease